MIIKERESFEQYKSLLELKRKKINCINKKCSDNEIYEIDNQIFIKLINIICGINKEISDNFVLYDMNNMELCKEIISYFELKGKVFKYNDSYSFMIKWYFENYMNSKNIEEKNIYWNKYEEMLNNRNSLLDDTILKLKEKEFKIIDLLKNSYVNKNLDEVVEFVLLNMKVKVNYSVFSKTFRELESNSLMDIKKLEFQNLILKYGKINDNKNMLNKDSMDIYIPVFELENNPGLKMIIMNLMGYGKGKIKRTIIHENNKIKRKTK